MGRPLKYPWSEWLDPSCPKIVELEKGVDFTVSPRQFQNYLATAARSRNVSIMASVRGDKVVVVILGPRQKVA